MPNSMYNGQKLARQPSYSNVAGACHILDNKEYDFTGEMPPDFKCPMCHNVLRDPVQLNCCGHRFCNSCFLNFSCCSKVCPIDREVFEDGQVFEDRAFRNKIMASKVRCKCTGCPWVGDLHCLLEEHVGACGFEEIKCPDPNCGVVLQRSQMQQHLEHDCLWRVVVCEFCDDKYAVCKQEVHRATCRGVPEKCPNNCLTSNIARGQMKHHLENDCPHTVLPCPYKHVGCNEDILREEMEGHLKESVQKHLDDACCKIRDMHFDLREKTVQMTQNALKLNMLSEQLARNVTANGAIVWAIDNFEIRFRQAVNGIEPVMQSEAATSGPFGYKFRALAYLNGDAKAKGSFISIYIQLLKGDHDALQQWPFQQEVKFTMIDQQNDPDERRDVIKVLAATGNNEGVINFQRPIKSSNTGRGYAKFVPHDVIRTRRYIRDDVMYVKIEVEPTGMV